MGANDPGLFELPEPAAPTVLPRVLRGRNRETWSRTVTAEVTVVDAVAIHEAFARAQEDAGAIGFDADLDLEQSEPGGLDEPGPTTNAFDALGWLIWPSDGLAGQLEAGALRILSMDIDVVPESADRGNVTWTVRIKLTDVAGLRKLATDAHPGEANEIADSLADAWRCAVDPFAPLRSVPGVAWIPGQVVVEHLPARAAGRA